MEQTNTWRKWRKKPKRTTSMTSETVQGNLLLEQDRKNINATAWFSSNQVSTTRVVSKCQRRWSNCFDTILQYFEKKTDQSKSESCHRCFVQNLRLAGNGQFERVWVICKKRRGPRTRFQYCVDPYSADTILYFRALQGHSGGKRINPTL